MEIFLIYYDFGGTQKTRAIASTLEKAINFVKEHVKRNNNGVFEAEEIMREGHCYCVEERIKRNHIFHKRICVKKTRIDSTIDGYGYEHYDL